MVDEQDHQPGLARAGRELLPGRRAGRLLPGVHGGVLQRPGDIRKNQGPVWDGLLGVRKPHRENGRPSQEEGATRQMTKRPLAFVVSRDDWKFRVYTLLDA